MASGEVTHDEDGTGRVPARRPVELLDMIWPETGLATSMRMPDRPKDGLSEDDLIELQIDFVTLALSPLELIQLAAFLRMSIDGVLDHHPSLQRAVVEAFDIRS
jgi:hypothetical protein